MGDRLWRMALVTSSLTTTTSSLVKLGVTAQAANTSIVNRRTPATDSASGSTGTVTNAGSNAWPGTSATSTATSSSDPVGRRASTSARGRSSTRPLSAVSRSEEHTSELQSRQYLV